MYSYIKEIALCDYLTDFSLKLPALGVYSVRSAFRNGGILLGAYISEGSNERLVGIVTLNLSLRPSITYFFVQEQMRGRGIGTKLLEEALACARSKSVDRLGSRIVMQNEFGGILDRMLKKAGFEAYTTATIIRYANDDKCKAGWIEFMNERGSRICKGLEKRGYRTLSFDEAPDEVFERLKGAMLHDFPRNLDPYHFIAHREHRVAMDYSFITLKDDMPAAFATVTTLDEKTLVFQQLSTACKYQGSGVFLLPFAAFMQRFLQEAAYSKASAVVYDSNDKMKKLVEHFLGSMAESMKTQYEYVCML